MRRPMERRVKEKKSAHLQGLEEVFERRTRRFSPFEVLGLRDEGELTSREPDQEKLDPPMGLNDPPMGGGTQPIPGMGQVDPEMGSLSPGMAHGGPEVGKPTPGLGIPTRVVVVTKQYNDTTTERPSPGVGLPAPQEGVLAPPVSGTIRPRGGSKEYGPLRVADLVAATQLGSRLAAKVRLVVGYLNSIRSLEQDSYTVPVGYGQISTAAGIDPDYLRRKVLPKLAMLGLIGVAHKSLEGTIYHLPYGLDYLRVVAGESIDEGRAYEAPPQL